MLVRRGPDLTRLFSVVHFVPIVDRSVRTFADPIEPILQFPAAVRSVGLGLAGGSGSVRRWVAQFFRHGETIASEGPRGQAEFCFIYSTFRADQENPSAYRRADWTSDHRESCSVEMRGPNRVRWTDRSISGLSVEADGTPSSRPRETSQGSPRICVVRGMTGISDQWSRWSGWPSTSTGLCLCPGRRLSSQMMSPRDICIRIDLIEVGHEVKCTCNNHSINLTKPESAVKFGSFRGTDPIEAYCAFGTRTYSAGNFPRLKDRGSIEAT